MKRIEKYFFFSNQIEWYSSFMHLNAWKKWMHDCLLSSQPLQYIEGKSYFCWFLLAFCCAKKYVWLWKKKVLFSFLSSLFCLERRIASWGNFTRSYCTIITTITLLYNSCSYSSESKEELCRKKCVLKFKLFFCQFEYEIGKSEVNDYLAYEQWNELPWFCILHAYGGPGLY